MNSPRAVIVRRMTTLLLFALLAGGLRGVAIAEERAAAPPRAIEIPFESRGIAISSDARWAVCWSGGFSMFDEEEDENAEVVEQIAVIDLEQRKVVAEGTCSFMISSVAIDGKFVYLYELKTNEITVLNAKTLVPVKTFATGLKIDDRQIHSPIALQAIDGRFLSAATANGSYVLFSVPAFERVAMPHEAAGDGDKPEEPLPPRPRGPRFREPYHPLPELRELVSEEEYEEDLAESHEYREFLYKRKQRQAHAPFEKRPKEVPSIGPGVIALNGEWIVDGGVFGPGLRETRSIHRVYFLPVINRRISPAMTKFPVYPIWLQHALYHEGYRHPAQSGLLGAATVCGNIICVLASDTHVERDADGYSYEDPTIRIELCLYSGNSETPLRRLTLETYPNRQNRQTNQLPAFSSLCAASRSRIAAIVDDRLYVIDIDPADEDLSAARSVMTFARNQSVIVADGERPFTLKHEIRFGKKPIQRRLLLGAGDVGLAFDEATGDVTVDGPALVQRAANELAFQGLLQRGELPPNEAVRRLASASAKDEFARLSGRPPEGIPAAYLVKLRAINDDLQIAEYSYYLLLDVPLQNVEREAAALAKERAAFLEELRRPQSGQSNLVDNEARLRRVKELEEEIEALDCLLLSLWERLYYEHHPNAKHLRQRGAEDDD